LSRRRVFLLRGTVVLMVLIGIIIAACGPSTPVTEPAPVGPTPSVTVPFELPITIALLGRFDGGTLAVLDEQIAAFEAANPDVKVEIITKPGSLSQQPSASLREQYAAVLNNEDTRVDILLLDDTWLAEFTANGWLTPLESYASSEGLELESFFPAAVEASTIDGQLMALPWTADGGLLYFRQDLLQRHNHEPPGAWTDVQRVAQAIQRAEGLPHGFVWQGAAYESLTCNTLEYLWAFGGQVLDEGGQVAFDSPGTRAALQQMADLVTSGVSPQETAIYKEATALAAFQEGDAALMRNWSYAWALLNGAGSALAGRVGVAPLPATCLVGQSLALSAYSLHPEQAFRLMAFLAGYDQQLQLALGAGQPPAVEAVYRDPALGDDAPFYAALHAALSAARPRPQSVGYQDLSAAIYGEVNEMLAGEQDVAATAANAQRGIEAAVHPQR
jgi:multiple sugar transport system substrate-binding protein